MPRRPPKAWFDKMKRKARAQYPGYGEERINKIVAGIWYGYRESTRRRILRRESKTGKKKYGKIGAPKSAKRKRWLRSIRGKR